jgi:hypothetical protein
VIKSKGMRWDGHAACMGDKKCINILVGKHQGKRTLGRFISKWQDKIKMDLTGVWNEDCSKFKQLIMVSNSGVF